MTKYREILRLTALGLSQRNIIPRYHGYDTKRYLLTGLKQLQSILMYDFQRDRLDKAIAKVQEAIDDEREISVCTI